MGRKGLIRFRCWYCNRKHVAGWDQVGVRRVCHCGERYRVPRNPGDIAWRARGLHEWLLEFVLYGLGGALLASLIFLAIVLLPLRIFLGVDPFVGGAMTLILLGITAVLGFLAGVVFGERGINFISSLWDDRRQPGG
jgi:hypothetical protein